MQHIEGKELMGVDRLIGISDKYELVICDRCKSDNHKDCLGKHATLTIAGEKIIGQCLCNNDAHNSLRKGNSDW